MREKLKNLFYPESVAVIGASNSFDKLGYHVMKSLAGNYAGRIYPINPKGEKVWGLDSFTSIGLVPGDVDLAVIVVPASLVPDTLHQCGRKGVKGVVLITAGFREIEDAQGEVLQEEIRGICEEYQLPVIGPNTFGFANITNGVNASFTSEFLQLEKGGVVLISQSGGICHLCGFLAIQQRVGLSALMSLGNRLNVDFPEALRFFAEEDEATRVIALYIEGLDEPRKLLDVVKSLNGRKPIVAYKAGKSEKGDSASKFHTGSLAGNHRIWTGALRQAGILEARSAEELIDTAKVLDLCAPAKGTRFAVLSGQAGPGVIAADALEAYGLTLSRFSAETQARINELLPPVAIRTNPVDMGPAWYNPRAMLDILNAVVHDEYTDGVIFIAVYASANIEVVPMMETFMKDNEAFSKPVAGVFTAPPGIWEESVKGLDGKKGMAILPTPERAARAMSNLWKAGLLKGDRENSLAGSAEGGEMVAEKLLLGLEAFRFLEGEGFSVLKTLGARNEEEAARAASEIGFPVALKIDSPDVVHKTETGGIRVSLRDETEVKGAFADIVADFTSANPGKRLNGVIVQGHGSGVELIMGTLTDDQFGPVLMCGLGGVFVEALEDVSFRLIPLAARDAKEMIEDLQGYKVLKNPRGQTIDLAAVQDLVLQVSRLVEAHPEVREMDLNPVFVSSNGVRICDARIKFRG